MKAIKLCLLLLVFSRTYAKDVNITTYGAIGDGQKAMDECHSSGGGKVTFPKGIFLSGF